MQTVYKIMQCRKFLPRFSLGLLSIMEAPLFPPTTVILFMFWKGKRLRVYQRSSAEKASFHHNTNLVIRHDDSVK